MKTYFKYLFLLLFINTAFAQLTVRNSAFIYVTDEIVFVENDVSLKESNSMFYLRNDGQLIQGAGVTGNSGIGQLSIFQNGTVDNYAYNYWCAPVGNTDADAFGNSAYRGTNNMYDWIGNSDPALNQITSNSASFTSALNGINSPLSISDRWLFSFSPGTEYSDWDYIGRAGNLDSGYGFSMKGTTGSLGQLYDFRGKPNSGNIPTDVLASQITLVGNPYPSALDTVDYIHDTTNSSLINGTLYFWEHDLSANSHFLEDYVGGYATYTINAAGSAETFVPARFDTYNGDGTLNSMGSASTTSKSIKRFIPTGQGFMVEGTGNGTIYTRNSHREYYKESNPSSVFFRNGSSNNSNARNKNVYEITYNVEGLQIMPDDFKRFRLNIDFNDSYSYQLIQNLNNNATEGFDYGLEVKQASDEAPEVYFKNANEVNQLLAQANKFDSDLRIPLYFNLTERKAVRVRIFDVQNFDSDQKIYLHDITTDAYYDLTQINFETNLDSGSHNLKYEITFRNFNEIITTTTPGLDNNNFTVLQNNNTSNLTILNPNNLKIKQISVYDVIGKRVMHNLNLNSNSRYEFSTNNLSDGAYIVKVNFDENNEIMNKKIIINNEN